MTYTLTLPTRDGEPEPPYTLSVAPTSLAIFVLTDERGQIAGHLEQEIDNVTGAIVTERYHESARDAAS